MKQIIGKEYQNYLRIKFNVKNIAIYFLIDVLNIPEMFFGHTNHLHKDEFVVVFLNKHRLSMLTKLTLTIFEYLNKSYQNIIENCLCRNLRKIVLCDKQLINLRPVNLLSNLY